MRGMRRRLMGLYDMLPCMTRRNVTYLDLTPNADYVIQIKADGSTPARVFGTEYYNRNMRVNGIMYYDLNYKAGYRISIFFAKEGVYEIECGNYYIKDLTTGRYLYKGTRYNGSLASIADNKLEINTSILKGDVYYDTPVYYVKIYIGGELLRDLVPVRRKSDNVYGWYDKVNNKFYKEYKTI